MDYKLALEITANNRSLGTTLNASGQMVRQFGQKAEQSFKSIGTTSKNAANQVKADWTKAAKDNSAAQAAFTKDATAANRKAAQEASRTLREVNAARSQAAQELGRGFLLTSAAFGLGILGVVNVTKNFNSQISTLGAVSDTAGEDLGRLRNAVLEAGKATVFSASEAAKGAQELARAGVSVENVIGGGLRGALNLAAAGQLDLGEASEIAATALNVFNLSGTQMSHVADVIAAGAGKAQGTVHEMGFALKQSALVANQFGLSLEETIGGLTLFAKNGLIGSDAGTSFRTMLLRLGAPTIEARGAMKQLGLEFYDAQDNFVGITNAADQLQQKLSGVSEEQRNAALSTIFGQDAIRGANILVNEGAAGYQKYIDMVNDFGYANRQASKNMDNLNGDLERLKGSLEVAIIGTGSQADGVLRELVQSLDLMVSAYSELPSSVQGGVLALAGFVAVGTGAVGLVGTMIPKYQALNAALLTMGRTGAVLSTGLKFTTLAMGGVAAAATAGLFIYGLYAESKAKAKAQTDRLTEALKAERDGQLGAGSAALQAEGAYKAALPSLTKLGISQTTYMEALRGSKAAQDEAVKSVLAANPALESNATNMKLVNDFLFNSQTNWRGASEAQRQFASQNPQLVRTLSDVREQYNKLSPSVRKSIEEAQKDKDTRKDVRNAALEMGKSFGKTGGDLEKFTQSLTGQKDELSDLAAELNVTREQLLLWGKGSEEVAESVGKDLKKAMEATSQSFSKFGDVIGNFSGQQSVVAGDIRTFYKDTIKVSSDFIRDIESAMKRGLDPSLISRLLQAGPEAASPILKTILADHSGSLIKMTNESESKLREINSLAVQLARITNLAVNGQTDQLAKDSATAMAIVQKNYETGGKLSAQALAQQLGIGLEDVRRITGQFGISVIDAGNEVRAAFNNAPIVFGKSPGFENATGDVDRELNVTRRAEGGFDRGEPAVAPAGAMVLWAEPETGGESYIPHAPSKRSRSVGILAQTADLFGLEVLDPRNGGSIAPRRFANGGIFGVYPPTPGGGGAISQAAYANMNHEYKLLEAFYEDMKNRQLQGSGWQAVTAFLQRNGVPFQVTSALRPGDLDSLHSTGKAVDMVGDMAQIYRALEPAARANQLQELFYDPLGGWDNGKFIGAIGGHSDHVHAATYDRGGYIPMGTSVVHNSSGRPEPVFTADQFDRLLERINGPGVAPINVYANAKSTAEIAREVQRKQRPGR